MHVFRTLVQLDHCTQCMKYAQMIANTDFVSLNTGKKFENRSTDNVFMTKLKFEKGFCISKRDNP